MFNAHVNSWIFTSFINDYFVGSKASFPISCGFHLLAVENKYGGCLYKFR